MKQLSTPFTKPFLSIVTAMSLLAGSPLAHSANTLTEALTGGKPSANLRLRYEGVNQSNALQNAKAYTARLRLGYTTDTYKGFGIMAEAESVLAFGGKNYNSTAAGDPHTTTHSLVADPEDTEINQAYLSYSGLPATVVKWGRQRITLDNLRFIGNVGWRQNEQTFDAISLVNKSLPDTAITAAYVTNVNRIFSDKSAATTGAAAGNHRMRSTLLNASYKGWSLANISGYAYLLDYDNTTGFTANSTNTYGIRLAGAAPIGGNKLLYTAEYANQKDAASSPLNYSADYTLLEAGVDLTGIATFKVGYELLGEDNGTAFKTPLATLHAFNGWADQFLATPNQGLQDVYISADTKLAGVNLGVVYHDFKADAAAIDDLGKEWDLVASYAFAKHYTVSLNYADYSTGAGTTNVDTKKTWLWSAFNF